MSSAFVTFYPFHRLQRPAAGRVLQRPAVQLSASPVKPSPKPPAAAPGVAGRALPPRHWRVPFIGVLLEGVATGDPGSSKKLADRYGALYRADLLGKPATYVTRRAEIMAVLRDGERFHSDGAWPAHFEALLGQSLFSGDGPAHARRRATVTPAFLPSMMPLLWPAVRASSDALWLRLHQQTAGRRAFAMMGREYRAFTFSVGLRLTIGEKLRVPQEELNSLFNDLSRGFFALELPFGLGPYEKAKRAKVKLLDHVRRTVTEKLETDREIIDELKAAGRGAADLQKVCYKMLKEGKLDIVSIILGHSDSSQQDITQRAIGTVLALWLASIETTAAAGSSAIYEMLSNQGLFDELVAEQDALQAEFGDLDYAQLSQMPLLDGFVSEVLRVRAPLPLVFRLAMEDTELAGYRIPRGTVMALDLRAANLSDVDYLDPLKIDIRRYMSENGETVGPAFVTFGHGQHTCLGNLLARIELKTSISTLLRKYQVVLQENVTPAYRSLPLTEPACMTPIRITPRRMRS